MSLANSVSLLVVHDRFVALSFHIESGIVRPSNNAQDVNLEISTSWWLGIDLNDITSSEVSLRNALYFASDHLAHGISIKSKCTFVSWSD